MVEHHRDPRMSRTSRIPCRGGQGEKRRFQREHARLSMRCSRPSCSCADSTLVETVGAVLPAVVGGPGGVRPAAAQVDVPETTAREWVRCADASFTVLMEIFEEFGYADATVAWHAANSVGVATVLANIPDDQRARICADSPAPPTTSGRSTSRCRARWPIRRWAHAPRASIRDPRGTYGVPRVLA